MDHTHFIKPLVLPSGYVAPLTLRYEDIEARALSRADLAADVKGINESIDVIQRTRGGDWPSGPVSAEFDFVDLVWHECELRENYSFSYSVYDAQGQYLGCCYLYPMGRRTPLDAKLLPHDVDVSWWVTSSAYQAGYYEKLFRALRQWSTNAFPFSNPFFSNREVPPVAE
ncbi:MAG: GNAT family N-acetyltransferase [Gemmatimonadaceae bacterium]